ncbi:glycosyltransferase family 2 protein [Oceanobacillus picturae]|uniref:glycosyltransferase family 2 protein n=1 Tax=Oceanobacillus picturae TaxID=171693 RepID=UPI00363F637D
MIKISIVIPTFNNTNENLNRLIDSLNSQSMNSKDFEIILVDDGSSDFDSYKRLKKVEKENGNVLVKSINASGWGSKPRNLGTQLAKGEYVFYCDDDDTLFPQALERMYKFAKDNNLDVVNPKVIRSKGWSWGWEEFKENVIDAQINGVQSMGPMTVPKLYKKEFLENNELAFSEGEKVWWEDVMFSCLVYSKGAKIGVLADYPVYHWREQNRSASFGKDINYKWSQLNNLADFFNVNLQIEDRDLMIAHWYNSRVLGAISKGFHKKNSSDQELEFENATLWRQKFVNENVLTKLNSKQKILDYILKVGNLKLAEILSEQQAGITARSYLDNISFENDKILITCSNEITLAEESTLKYNVNKNGFKINLPDTIEKEIPKELLYFDSEEVENAYYLPAIKGRFSRATWDVKTVKHSKIHHKKRFGKISVYGELKFLVNINNYALDEKDYYQPWDIATRFSFLDCFSQRAIASKEDFRKAAIINGNTYVVYKNKSELISIDLNSTIIDFFSVAYLNVDDLIINDNMSQVTIPINKVHTFGDSRIDLDLVVRNKNIIGFVDSDGYIESKNNKSFLKINLPVNCSGATTVKMILNNKVHSFDINV